MNTTWEQLESAAVTLARSGAMKDRLVEAWRNHLSLVSIEELPEALRAEFGACHEALTRERPLRGEDAVRASVRKMSAQDADAIAERVVRLFAALVHEAVRADRPAEPTVIATPAVNGAAHAVPRSKRKAVPQVISIYTAEAQLSRA